MGDETDIFEANIALLHLHIGTESYAVFLLNYLFKVCLNKYVSSNIT